MTVCPSPLGNSVKILFCSDQFGSSLYFCNDQCNLAISDWDVKLEVAIGTLLCLCFAFVHSRLLNTISLLLKDELDEKQNKGF